MKRKIFTVLLALVLVCSFSMVAAVPAGVSAADNPYTLAGSTITVTSLAEPYETQTEEAFNDEPHTTVVDDVAFDVQTCSQVVIEGEVSGLNLGTGWLNTAYVEIGLRPELTKTERNAGVYLIAFNLPGEGGTRIHLQDYTGNGNETPATDVIDLPTRNASFSYEITLAPSGNIGGTATLKVWDASNTLQAPVPSIPYGYASTWDEDVAGAHDEDFSNAHLFYSIIAECRGAADQTYSATVGAITIDDTLYVGAAEQFPTIQEAINFANPGDTIDVAAGTYNECLNVNESVSIVGAGVLQVTINESGAGFNNSCIYVSVDDVSLQGFTLVGNKTISPDYGIKFGAVSGGSVQHVLVENARRTGFDFLGTTSTTVSDIESRNNGGHGIQLCDCTDVALLDVTTSGSSWQAVNVATWGDHTTLGTSGIVFSGTNSFGDVFQLEEGDFDYPSVPPSGEAIITYSTNPADNADVTVQASDFGFALHGDQDDGPGQNRVWFFKTLADAQTMASLGSFGHFNGEGVYVESLTDRTQLYISPGCEIQAAVDAALSGGIISVAEGAYAPFTVNTKIGLIIRSDSMATVQGAQLVATAYTDRGCVVFVKDSTNIVLDGLDIEGLNLGGMGDGGRDYGVIYENSSGVIKDCTVSPNTSGDVNSIAIGIWDGSGVTVDTCTIHNFGRVGMLIYNGCTARVLDSTIVGQIYDGEDEVSYGIEVEAKTEDPATASHVTIKGNEIYNCDNTFSPQPSWESAGVYINGWLEHYDPLEADCTVIVENNDIHDNYIGIYAIKTPSSHAHYNNIHDNRVYGAISAKASDDSTAVFDATNNWWGDASGPSGEGSGTGDAVSTNVDFDPWSTDADFTGSASQVGFTAAVSNVIAITVSPIGIIDFGPVVPGIDAVGDTITVGNAGNVLIGLSISLENEVGTLYTDYLYLDAFDAELWIATSVGVRDSAMAIPKLSGIPADFAPGTYTATLVFWAEMYIP